jgi:hypothetical protein
VPSGELSSTTSSSRPVAAKRSMKWGSASASLYVGTTTDRPGAIGDRWRGRCRRRLGAAGEGERQQLGQGDGEQLAGGRHQPEGESQGGGRARPDGGGQRDDERAVPQAEAAGRQGHEDAEQPREGERAEEQEGVEAAAGV